MSQNWSLPERKLVSELCVGMARNMSDVLTIAEGEYYWHMATSCFEKGCNILWKLGVAVGATESGEADITFQEEIAEQVFPSRYKFLSPNEIRSKILDGVYPASLTTTEEIISSYLGVVCDYGPNELLLSASRAEFKPQEVYLKEIDALVNMGYLERHGSNVMWTDKISIAMKNNYFWDEGGSSSDLQQENIEQECIRLLDQIPEHTKLVLAKEAKQLSQLKFMLLLHDQFNGLFMSKNPDGSKRSDISNPQLVFAIQDYLRK
ncbi:MAG: hypothetical protein AB8B92_01220 [Gammaproteobacteria bacterium]